MRDNLLLRFAPAAGATIVVGLVVVTRTVQPTVRAIALACMGASWIAAIAFRRPDLRARLSVVLAIAAATAAGLVNAGPLYGIASGALILGCLASMRALRLAKASEETERRRPPVRTLAVLLGTSIAVTTGLILGLPRLAAVVEQRLNSMFGGEGIEATAFSTAMVLGATRGMLVSDVIVLRIDGERPEYLRGAVYDRYDGTQWRALSAHTGRKTVIADAPFSSGGTRITLVRGAPNGDDMRWFLPPGACDLGLKTGIIDIDAFGVARRDRLPEPATINLRTKGCKVATAHVADPAATDLDVPPDVRRSLEPIALGWTAAKSSTRAKLDAINDELKRFEYSLAVPRDLDIDPIVDFLTIHRAGHCELFASAMVLLARTQGIPARVVGGYRVSEVNPITRQAVVRDRNAHAWVEAWVDGAWRAWDPTPASETFAKRAGLLDHLGDLVSGLIDRTAVLIVRLGTLGALALLCAAIVILLVIRWFGSRIRRRRVRVEASRQSFAPLPCFDALTEALEKLGQQRVDSEPVETYAHRIARLAEPWAAEAADAILRYAQLRYGGIGDEAAVARKVDSAARTVTRARM